MDDSTLRLQVRITREFDRKLTAWANRLGLTKSQLSNMALQSGLSNIIRAVAPEEALTPQEWGKIFDAIGPKRPEGLPDEKNKE